MTPKMWAQKGGPCSNSRLAPSLMKLNAEETLGKRNSWVIVALGGHLVPPGDEIHTLLLDRKYSVETQCSLIMPPLPACTQQRFLSITGKNRKRDGLSSVMKEKKWLNKLSDISTSSFQTQLCKTKPWRNPQHPCDPQCRGNRCPPPGMACVQQ